MRRSNGMSSNHRTFDAGQSASPLPAYQQNQLSGKIAKNSLVPCLTIFHDVSEYKPDWGEARRRVHET